MSDSRFLPLTRSGLNRPGAVAQSAGAKALGWFAILLCGLGPFYALFYAFSPHVPRQALRPWGLNKDPQPQP